MEWSFNFCGKSVAGTPFVLSLHKHLHTHSLCPFCGHFHFINDLCLAPSTSFTETHKHHTLLAQEVAHCFSWRDVKVLIQHTLPPSNLLGSELNGYPWFSNPVVTASADCMKMIHLQWDFYLWLHKYKTTTQTNRVFPKSFKALYRTNRPGYCHSRCTYNHVHKNKWPDYTLTIPWLSKPLCVCH